MTTWRAIPVERFALRRRQQVGLDAGGDAEGGRNAEQQRQRQRSSSGRHDSTIDGDAVRVKTRPIDLRKFGRSSPAEPPFVTSKAFLT